MTDFHTLRVSEVKKETDDTVSIAFDIPPQLKNIFSYKQGQYLTFKKFFMGEEVRRSYSLCSSPVTDDLWRVAVKKVENGKFSSYANKDLKEGDVLEVMPPEGNFTSEVAAGQKKDYVLFAAGSGITPIMSILKTVLEVESESTIHLYYGNKNSSSVIFKAELEELSSKYANRLNITYVFSREPDEGAMEGRISADLFTQFELSNSGLYSADEYFICGPEEMIFNVQDHLAEKNVAGDKVHFELFTTPVKKEEESSDDSSDIDIEASVKVIVDGEEHEFQLHSKGDSILDAAMDEGADVPFSCKGAVCCTCRAKVMEGSVRMEMNYALTDGEVEEGYVLTCQSHPTSEKVVIDYDED